MDHFDEEDTFNEEDSFDEEDHFDEEVRPFVTSTCTINGQICDVCNITVWS